MSFECDLTLSAEKAKLERIIKEKQKNREQRSAKEEKGEAVVEDVEVVQDLARQYLLKGYLLEGFVELVIGKCL